MTHFWILFCGLILLSVPGEASCRIHNDTKYSFTVESGNTSNQRVGSHTRTSIAAGKIVGKSAEGKTISGSCKDFDELLVTEKSGVPILSRK